MPKTKIKTRLDLETICKTCGLCFTIHDIDYLVGKDPDSGWDLTQMKCPSCEQSNFSFDIIRVEEKYPIAELVKYHRGRSRA